MKLININNKSIESQNLNIQLFVMPDGLSKKEKHGIKLLMERSLVGEFTPINRYFKDAKDILNLLSDNFALEMADTAHEILIRVALPKQLVTKNIIKQKRNVLEAAKPQVRTKLKMEDGHFRKEVGSVNPSFPTGFGSGFMKEGQQIVSYDTSVAYKCYDIAARKLLLDVMSGGNSPDNMDVQQLQAVLEDQRTWLENGHPMGQKSFCSRLRSYWNAGFILNAGASKWMRACIRIANGPKTTWNAIQNPVFEFFGALTGNENKLSWEANLVKGKKAFFRAVKDYKKDLLTLEYSSYEEVWAYRLIKEYVNNEEDINTGKRFFWTVPVEFDQHASFAAYQGALLGSREMLYLTNSIRNANEIDVRKDFYGYNPMWHRPLVKPIATQTAYGKSLKGGSWSIVKNDKNAMELLERLGVLDNGELRNDTPEAMEIRKELNSIWKWVNSLPTVTWAGEVTKVANEYYKSENWETNRFKVEFGFGDYIIAECSKIQHDRGYDEDGVYVDQEKIDWITETLPRFVFSRSEGKLMWISKEIRVPRYVHPEFGDFGRFMPTGWTHHQDAITMDHVMDVVLSFGWEAYSIHDAIICHPACTETVQDIVRKRLLFIYKNRESLMEALFSNWGENPYKNDDPFGIRSGNPSSEISEEEFMNGRPMKF